MQREHARAAAVEQHRRAQPHRLLRRRRAGARRQGAARAPCRRRSDPPGSRSRARPRAPRPRRSAAPPCEFEETSVRSSSPCARTRATTSRSIPRAFMSIWIADPAVAEERERVVEVQVAGAAPGRGRAAGRARRRTRPRRLRPRRRPRAPRCCSRARPRRRRGGRTRAGARRPEGTDHAARLGGSDAEGRLEQAPGREREEHGQEEQHREHDPEARVRAARGVLALAPRACAAPARAGRRARPRTGRARGRRPPLAAGRGLCHRAKSRALPCRGHALVNGAASADERPFGGRSAFPTGRSPILPTVQAPDFFADPNEPDRQPPAAPGLGAASGPQATGSSGSPR